MRYPGNVNDILRIGIDLGGTKTEAVVVRLRSDSFEVLARRRIATERDAGYAHIVARTAALASDIVRDAGLTTLPPVGVGMPGSISLRAGQSGTHRPALSNFMSWGSTCVATGPNPTPVNSMSFFVFDSGIAFVFVIAAATAFRYFAITVRVAARRQRRSAA